MTIDYKLMYETERTLRLARQRQAARIVANLIAENQRLRQANALYAQETARANLAYTDARWAYEDLLAEVETLNRGRLAPPIPQEVESDTVDLAAMTDDQRRAWFRTNVQFAR